MLTITSIYREPQDAAGTASSAALKVYQLLMDLPPDERERKARGVIKWAEAVCDDLASHLPHLQRA